MYSFFSQQAAFQLGDGFPYTGIFEGCLKTAVQTACVQACMWVHLGTCGPSPALTGLPGCVSICVGMAMKSYGTSTVDSGLVH